MLANHGMLTVVGTRARKTNITPIAKPQSVSRFCAPIVYPVQQQLNNRGNRNHIITNTTAREKTWGKVSRKPDKQDREAKLEHLTETPKTNPSKKEPWRLAIKNRVRKRT